MVLLSARNANAHISCLNANPLWGGDSLRWRHNGRDSVSYHQPRACTQPFIQAQIKENIKLRVTGLCGGNSPVTDEFPAQIASNAENVPIWCRHHVIIFFSCDQAAPWMVQSVCLSHLFDYVPIIVSSWNFQELLPITEVMSMQKVKVKGQRSWSEVNAQLSRFLTVTPVWFHIWRWNDAQSLMLLKRGALLFFKVIRQISRSHG